MKRILLALLILSSNTSFAIKVDSLLGIWNNKSLHDTIRLKAIDDLAYFYVDTKIDSAEILIKKELELATEVKIPKWLAYAYNTKGLVLTKKGAFEETINSFITSINFCKISGEKQLELLNHNSLGTIYETHGMFPKALENYLRYLHLCIENGDLTGEATAYNNIGIVYCEVGEYAKGLEYYFKALKLYDPRRKTSLANCYSNIGMAYYYQKDYQQGLQYLAKGKKLFEELGNGNGIANFYLNRGNILKAQGDYKNTMGDYLEGMKIYEQISNKQGMAETSNSIGELYILLKDFSQARKSCERSLKLSIETNSLSFEKNACNCLYEAYKGLGNNARALEYFEQSLKLGDSLKKEETAKSLQKMEYQRIMLADSLKQAEAKRKVELAHKEQMHRQQIQKIILFSVITIVLVMIWGVWRRLRYTRRAKVEIEKEKDRSENLLLNILPSEVAEELKASGKAEARDFEQVSILFSDFKEFAQVSEKLSAKELVSEINYCFEAFDGIMTKYGIEKIKTIGDSYMAAGGIPVPDARSVKNTVKAGLEMQQFIQVRKNEREELKELSFEMRLGIHTGPVVAGIVGVKKFQYDIWGDTVNTASRMESSGVEGKVNISRATYDLIKDDPEFTFEYRGKITAKNKGEIDMYFVSKT